MKLEVKMVRTPGLAKIIRVSFHNSQVIFHLIITPSSSLEDVAKKIFFSP